MSTEDMSLVSPQNGITSQLVFQDDTLRFNCSGPPAPHQRRVADPKTRELTGFIDDNKLFSTATSAVATTATSAPSSDRYFQHDYPRNIYRRDPHGTSGDESDGEDDEDDDDDEEDEVDDDDVDGRDRENGVDILVAAIDSNSKNTDCNNNNSNVNSTVNVNNSIHLDKIGNGNAKPKHLTSFGEMMAAKDGGSGGMGQGGSGPMTIAEVDGEMYYSHYLQGTEGSGGGGKDMGVENGCGFSGRKEVSSFSNESGESLRAILSDPVTGALMDDAMILLCGHSFGGGGIQHVIRTKACYSCSQSISEDSIAPNLSLRAAVQAFRREEELHLYRSSKRRKERDVMLQAIQWPEILQNPVIQDKGAYGDSAVIDAPRGRGVQFPFAVTDRVIIKGNKRTPQRFVGREAVVTTQCLNGWYVVKTLDNAESVKLQYRSLAKVSDDPSSKAMSSKMGPNWL